MKLLLDSHALLWAGDQPSQLSSAAAAVLRDPGCFHGTAFFSGVVQR